MCMCKSIKKISSMLVANVWEDGLNGLLFPHTYSASSTVSYGTSGSKSFPKIYIFFNFASSLDDNCKDAEGRYFLLLLTDTRDEVIKDDSAGWGGGGGGSGDGCCETQRKKKKKHGVNINDERSAQEETECCLWES